MDEDKDELTVDESTEQEAAGATAGEAHREGEFVELKDLLTEVMSELAAMRGDLAKVIEVKNAQAIDNGAVIEDTTDAPGDIEIIDDAPVIAEDRDYTFDEKE